MSLRSSAAAYILWRLRDPVLAIASTGSLVCGVPGQSGPGAAVPAVSADTLAGTHVRLPEDLRGRTGVLILGFSKDSRTEAAAWGTRLANDASLPATLMYFEMPVIAGVPRLLRGYVLRAIAADVAPIAKPHFLPISEQEAQWRTLVHYRDPNAAYVVVVDGAGRVAWQTTGDASDAAYAALRQHLPPAAAAR